MDTPLVIPALLLDCLGRKSPDELAETVSDICAAEWDDFVLQAQQHQVAPLVYYKLKSMVPGGAVPSQVVHKLHQNFLQNAARNLLVYRQLEEILKKIAEVGIPVIVLKGGYLAEAEYLEVALRPMADLDILLRKEDLGRAEKALWEMGYSSLRPYMAEVDSVHHQHILPFTSESGVPVEVHWNVFDPETPFCEDAEGLWLRSVPSTLAGREVRALCLEDLILHLSIHCAYHHYFSMGLSKLYDVNLLLRNHGDDVDWPGLFLRAEEWGFDRCLLLTLTMVSELLGTFLPGDVVAAVRDAKLDPDVRSLAVEQLFLQQSETELSPTMTDLIEKKGLIQKAIFLLTRIFPSKKEIARMYPVAPESARVYLYYPVRVRDLLYRYGKGFWQVIRRDKTALENLNQKQKKERLKQWMREG